MTPEEAAKRIPELEAELRRQKLATEIYRASANAEMNRLFTYIPPHRKRLKS